MKFDISSYEDEFLDDEDCGKNFKKISHKAKNTKQNKKSDGFRKQRKIKEKQRDKSLYELNNRED